VRPRTGLEHLQHAQDGGPAAAMRALAAARGQPRRPAGSTSPAGHPSARHAAGTHRLWPGGSYLSSQELVWGYILDLC